MSVEHYAHRARRPIGVTILAVLIILVGILAVLGSLALLGIGVLLIPNLGFVAVAVGVVALIISFLLLAAGFALLSLRPWAWWLSVIVLFLYLAGQAYLIYAGVSGFGIIGVVIPALIFLYLIAVRKHFH